MILMKFLVHYLCGIVRNWLSSMVSLLSEMTEKFHNICTFMHISNADHVVSVIILLHTALIIQTNLPVVRNGVNFTSVDKA